MIPKQAIEKAIEGGWHFRGDVPDEVTKYGEVMVAYTMWCDVALDPAFWQSLGKALGWKEHMGNEADSIGIWFVKANQFHRLILTGGGTEKFWDDLLK